MHPEDCQCEYCSCYVNIPWVELTLREGVHWSPAVYCPTCGLIEIHEVVAGKIGVTTKREPASGTRKE